MTSGLVVLEGPDGVGKTTLSLALCRSLREAGCQAEMFAFPGAAPGSLGQLVYSLHHEAQIYGVSEKPGVAALQLLHVAAHVDEVAKRVAPALERGGVVVLDRYWWSTAVYGRVAGVSAAALNHMIAIEMEAWQGVRPSAVFLVQRKSQFISTANEAIHQRLRGAYARLARREATNYPVYPLDNNGELDSTTREIRDVLSRGLLNYAPPSGPQLPRESSVAPRLRSLWQDTIQDKVTTKHSVRPTALTVISRLSPARPTVVFDTYWRFAAERQSVFFRRLRGQPPPLTDDPIIQQFKFTNAYRASDRVSQYLIRNVIYPGDQSPTEVFFRTILFKLFNRIETWERLDRELGPLTAGEFDVERYGEVLSRARAAGDRVYSAAYIMPSGGTSFGSPTKHLNHLRLLQTMLKDELPKRLQDCPSMQSVFVSLRSYPTIGDFLAYQFATDLNYSDGANFSEMEFVIPGPGARDGIRKCFRDLGGLSEVEMLRIVADQQEREFERLGVKFESLWGRRLQLIDCQNLFCEVDKYSRLAHPEFTGVSGRSRIKQRYQTTPPSIDYWYPPKWGINEKVAEDLGQHRASV